jgi:hypothetical protein
MCYMDTTCTNMYLLEGTVEAIKASYRGPFIRNLGPPPSVLAQGAPNNSASRFFFVKLSYLLRF